MLCQLFLTTRLLLSLSPFPLQPLSYLFSLRMTFSFLFHPSSPLLFPPMAAFFLPPAPLLVLAAAVFFLLPNRLHLLTAAHFFPLPNRLRLLTAALFFFHPSYCLSLLLCNLPLLSPLFCQPQSRGFPYGPALVIL
jgi:hypothetical protein